MPRNPPAASTLRNRNRITNKSRLKLYQGSLDADFILIPDEDEERHIFNNLVAGVDAEDANVSIFSALLFCHSTIILWLCDPRIKLQICWQITLYRSTTCRRFSLQSIGMKELRAESQLPLRSQPLFLPQILPESLITMMNYIYPINGRTRRAMQSRLPLLKRTLLMD